MKALIQHHEATQDARIVRELLRSLQRLDERSLAEWARFRWADLVASIHLLHVQLVRIGF
ncbi:MAG: hypothetical protein H0W23_01720 [Chloroflexia bacterium]|nr:hypothetical protein [Chloroflexia bacterium]